MRGFWWIVLGTVLLAALALAEDAPRVADNDLGAGCRHFITNDCLDFRISKLEEQVKALEEKMTPSRIPSFNDALIKLGLWSDGEKEK